VSCYGGKGSFGSLTKCNNNKSIFQVLTFSLFLVKNKKKIIDSKYLNRIVKINSKNRELNIKKIKNCNLFS
jgi:hypothetical protein